MGGRRALTRRRLSQLRKPEPLYSSKGWGGGGGDWGGMGYLKGADTYIIDTHLENKLSVFLITSGLAALISYFYILTIFWIVFLCTEPRGRGSSIVGLRF